MIEDMQDELQVNNAVKRPKGSKSAVVAFVFLFWFVYAAIFALIYVPKIKAAVNESNFFEVLKNYKSYSKITDSKQGTLHFVTFDSMKKGETVACETLIPMTGATNCHDLLEGLLSGPRDELVSEGFTTCIDKDVRLLGLTISNSYAFVSLSEEYLKCDSLLARAQILNTLQVGDSSVHNLVVLIDGQEMLDTPS